MIRGHVVPRFLRGEKDFHWRGGDVSRVEALSDGVFALALALLVVSLDPPTSFSGVTRAFAFLPVFLACFLILVMCWYFHYLFHRRYGLEDFFTIAVNSLLLFVILFYVYPLRFLFDVLFGMFSGSPLTTVLADGSNVPIITNRQMPTLMVLYSSGFAAIFFLFSLLELHAYRLRDALGLDAREIAASRSMLRSHLISAGFGVVSILMALSHDALVSWSGVIYMLLGPVQGLHGYLSGKAIERIPIEE